MPCKNCTRSQHRRLKRERQRIGDAWRVERDSRTIGIRVDTWACLRSTITSILRIIVVYTHRIRWTVGILRIHLMLRILRIRRWTWIRSTTTIVGIRSRIGLLVVAVGIPCGVTRNKQTESVLIERWRSTLTDRPSNTRWTRRKKHPIHNPSRDSVVRRDRRDAVVAVDLDCSSFSAWHVWHPQSHHRWCAFAIEVPLALIVHFERR